MKKITMVIPAAGVGKRFGELCHKTPKPMLKIWGKPILEHILSEVSQSGIIDKIILVVGYKKEKIINYFGDGKNLGLSIKYVIQKEPRGTAQALYFCQKFISENLFFLQWSDIIIPSFWYQKLLNALTPPFDGVITVDWLGDWKTGAGVILDKNRQVVQVLEKPQKISERKIQWNNSGIHFLNKRVFSFFPKKFPKNKEIYFTEILEKFIWDSGIIRGLPIAKKYYYDLKNKEIYNRLTHSSKPEFLQEKTSFF